jgi:hypothetical protein
MTAGTRPCLAPFGGRAGVKAAVEFLESWQGTT